MKAGFMTLSMKTCGLPQIHLSTPSRAPRLRFMAVLVSAVALGGCASFSPDGGLATVEKAAKDRLGMDAQWARSGADQDAIDKRVGALLSRPLAVDNAVPLPDNTAAMMTGTGPFGSVGMGGMFSVFKVRKDQKPGDYKDPGWYKHPPGEVAYEWTGSLPDPARFKAEGGSGSGSMPPLAKPTADTEVTVRKPGAGSSQHKQH